MTEKPHKYECWECEGFLSLTTGAETYPHRADRRHLQYWICRICHSWVIARAKDGAAMGLPANAMLRAMRMEIYELLTPVVQAKANRDGIEMRAAMALGQAWLAKQIEFSPQSGTGDVEFMCQSLLLVNFMLVEDCRKAKRVLEPYAKANRK